MTTLPNQKRIVAFDVHPRTFGFAVFEGPDELLNCGARSLPKGTNAVRVPLQEKLAAIFDEFDPATVVLADQVPHRSKRTSKIGEALQKEAVKHGISVRFVTPGTVKKAFAGCDSNKHEIASALSQQFPVLASMLPPKRKIWQTECYRMSMFDAAALGVAYFSRRKLDPGGFATTQPLASPD
jgi:hypothetical protein